MSTTVESHRPAVLIRGTTYPIVLPKLSDARLHLAATIISLQILGQTVLDFQLSIAQILVSILTCATLELTVVLHRQKALVWPASALLTGNGVAFVLRVPGTEHGDWWSLNGAWIFAATAAVALLSKYVIRLEGRHIFNPSNFGLVLCFLVLGDGRAQPLDLWWGPMSPGLAAALAIIVGAGLAILARLRMLMIAAGFWISFALGVAVVAATGHSITARWHLGPIAGWSFWWLLVSSPEILVFLFFMITDPRTTPTGARARTVYAVSVGLLATLLLAPQTTEFATKVAILAALAVVCLGRPFVSRVSSLFGRRWSMSAASRRALVLAGAGAYVAVLVGAASPARPAEGAAREALRARGPAGVQVTTVKSQGVASEITRPMALQMAQDLVTDLRVQSDALRSRNSTQAAAATGGPVLSELRALIGASAQGPIVVPVYHVERVRLSLSAGPDQSGPRVLASVRGTVERTTYAGSSPMLTESTPAANFQGIFELAESAGGYRIIGAPRLPPVGAGAGDVRPVAVALALLRRGPAPLGTTVAVRATIENQDAAARPVTLEFRIVGPRDAAVVFDTAKVIVPGKGRVSRRASVTPSQWFASPGRFSIRATADGRVSGPPLAFDVSRPTVVLPRFQDVTKQVGIFSHPPVPTCGQFSNGAAWGDVNGDGLPDLFLTRLGKPAELFVADGRGRFNEQAAARGVAVRDAVAAAFADYDNDGYPDLYVARDGKDMLLHNDGRGRFVDVTSRAGIHDGAPGASVAWGDYNNDGLLDIYVASYITCIGDLTSPYALTSKVRYYPDVLYRNNGNGTFSRTTPLLGAHTTNGAGFAASWLDYDGDNRQDLYLGNDFIGGSPDHNHLWRNTGTAKRFSDVSARSGTAFFANTMGIAVGDFNRDLRPDIALSDIGAKKLLLNLGDGTFVDVAAREGVARPQQRADVPSITWGVGSYDLNLDGWEDLYFAAGNILQSKHRGPQPSELYVNDGTGKHFLDVSAPSGANDPGDSKGLAFADFDGDGRVDIASVDQDRGLRLYRNVTPIGRSHWLEVSLRGAMSNRNGCGARVVLRLANRARMMRAVACGANDSTLHFGLGQARGTASLEIVWPSGVRQQVRHVVADHRLSVKETAR